MTNELPQDSFYRGLTPEEMAHVSEYNFDHPGTLYQKASMDYFVSNTYPSIIREGVRVLSPSASMKMSNRNPLGLHLFPEQEFFCCLFYGSSDSSLY